MTQEALKLAVEELVTYAWHGEACPQHPTYSEPENYPKCTCGYDKAITAIKEALADHAMSETQRLGQEIDPIVGKWGGEEIGWAEFQKRSDDYFTQYGVHIPLPLPLPSPQRPWVGLTELEQGDKHE